MQPSLNPKNDTAQDVAEMIERDPRLRERPGPFEFWYRLTAPSRQPLTAPFELREAERQGRLTSTVLAMVAGSLVILAVPTSLALHNPTLLIVLIVLLTVVSIALFLNRIGKGFWGRLMVVITMNISLIISVITWTGGLTTNTLPIFDIIVVEPTLVAVVLLPPTSVFFLAIANAAFIGLDFYFQSRSVDLQHFMSFDSYEIVTRPLYLLLFVVGVVYPVMRNVLRAIAVGDRAKEIAKVQRDLAEQERLVAEEKRLLDADIQDLIQVLANASHGQWEGRIPLPRHDRSLWPLVGSLNTLLSRFRNALRSEAELRQAQDATTALVEALLLSKQTQQPLRMPRKRSPLTDQLLMALLEGGNPVRFSKDIEQRPSHHPQF